MEDLVSNDAMAESPESLIEFLGKFSCTDNIPKFSKGDIEDGSDIASSSDSESE